MRLPRWFPSQGRGNQRENGASQGTPEKKGKGLNVLEKRSAKDLRTRPMKCAGSQSEFFLTGEDMRGNVKRIIAKANYQTTTTEGSLTRLCQYSVNKSRLFLDNSSIISILYQAPHAPLSLFNPVLQSAHPPFHGRRFPYESGAACVSRIIRTREEKPSRKGLSRGKGPACGVRTGGAVRGGGWVRHLDMQNMHMKNMDIPAGP